MQKQIRSVCFSKQTQLKKQQNQKQPKQKQQKQLKRALTTKPAPSNTNSPSRPRRSFLYIPGSSQKMLNKAPLSGADAVCFDLEDGVSFTSKELARTNIAEFLTSKPAFPHQQEVCLRINATSSGLFEIDCEWLQSLPFAPHSIALPKMDTVEDFKSILSVIKDLEIKHGSKIELIGMVETPIAVINLPAILQYSLQSDSNHQHLTALIFGGDDYASAGGCIRTDTNHELSFPRSMTLLHAAAHNIQVIDIVCKEFKDTSRFTIESIASVEKGFSGRQCIHPNQIPLANSIYSPTKDAIEWASGVMVEYHEQEAKGVGAWTYKGMMIDMPTIKRALNVLDRAKACGMVTDQPFAEQKQ